MKILVTGSAGFVGRPVCREVLRRGHQVRGLDRVPTPGLRDAVVADIADASPVREAVRGVDAVIHLAAQPEEAEWARLVGPNVVGLSNVMNAAREEKVPRVVLASSVMVVAGRKSPLPVRADDACPRTHYALTKLLAEQMGEMYARCFGMSVLAVRLGWMVRTPDEAAKLRAMDVPDLFCSARDAGRLFAQAAETEARPRRVRGGLRHQPRRRADLRYGAGAPPARLRSAGPLAGGDLYELPNAELAADPDVDRG